MAGQKTGGETLIFMYDNNGDAFGFNYNGEEYYYIKNVNMSSEWLFHNIAYELHLKRKSTADADI